MVNNLDCPYLEMIKTDKSQSLFLSKVIFYVFILVLLLTFHSQTSPKILVFYCICKVEKGLQSSLILLKYETKKLEFSNLHNECDSNHISAWRVWGGSAALCQQQIAGEWNSELGLYLYCQGINITTGMISWYPGQISPLSQ